MRTGEVVSLVLSAGALLVAFLGFAAAVAGIFASYLIAKHYGDLAAVEATRKLYEEEKARARRAALHSLLFEVERIMIVRCTNAEMDPNSPAPPVTKLPVGAFERAFASGAPGVLGSEDLREWAQEYLGLAARVNSLVDVFALASENARRIQTAGEVKRLCKDDLHKALVSLKACLRDELGLPVTVHV